MIDPYKGIPKRVKVGSYFFRIEVRDFEDHEAEGSFGHMNPINQKIRLRPGMTAQNLANTFIHEVMHAIYWFHSAGHFSLANGEQTIRDIEEEYVTKGANGLCAFVQDNPRAISWWRDLINLKGQA